MKPLHSGPTLAPAPALALALAAALLAAPGAARACSVVPDYRVPTNLELAADANAIILGRVVAGTRFGAGGEPEDMAVEVRPLDAVKGLMPGEALVLPGMALAGPGAGLEAGDPLDFGEAHPEAYSGACNRYSFAEGATVLFFLRRTDGGWAPAGGPFSRWAEDVSGPGAPWVELARLYAHAAQLPPDEREALLADQLEALQWRISVDPEDEVALAIATDIERSMAAPGFPLLPERAPEPGFDLAAEIAAEQAEQMDEEIAEEADPDDPAGLGELGRLIDGLGRGAED